LSVCEETVLFVSGLLHAERRQSSIHCRRLLPCRIQTHHRHSRTHRRRSRSRYRGESLRTPPRRQYISPTRWSSCPSSTEIWTALSWRAGILVVAYAFAMRVHRRNIA